MYTIIAPVPVELATAIEPHRQRFDPLANINPPHISVLRPFRFAGSAEELQAHLEQIGETYPPIKVSLAGWDATKQTPYLLRLPLIAGRPEFVDLHNDLLTGPLRQLAGSDEAYQPNVTLSRFSSLAELEEARKILQGFEPRFVFRVTHLELWQRDTPTQPWQTQKTFGLKGTLLSASGKKKSGQTINQFKG